MQVKLNIKPNVLLHGHLSASFGLGDGAAATKRTLLAAGCTVQAANLRLQTHPSVHWAQNQQSHGPSKAKPLIDLVHTNPNILQLTRGLINVDTLTAPLRIGYWAWELEHFPDGWEQHFADYDEIWCPSQFCAQSLSQRSPIPVIALPHLPYWERLDQLRHQRQQRKSRKQGVFRILVLFDFWSSAERKNPSGAIAAFQEAFPLEQLPQSRAVELLIKTSSAEQFSRLRRQLEASTQADPRIHWIDGVIPRDDLDQLFLSADAFLSLHRSEGFGLNIADAMAIGVPVVATGYSGNLDFMPPGSAELVPWSPTTVPSGCPLYPTGALWAEPDISAAAQALRRLEQQPTWAAELGRRGAIAVRERLATQRLVAIVQQRLGQLMLMPSRKELLTHLPADHPSRLLSS